MSDFAKQAFLDGFRAGRIDAYQSVQERAAELKRDGRWEDCASFALRDMAAVKQDVGGGGDCEQVATQHWDERCQQDASVRRRDAVADIEMARERPKAKQAFLDGFRAGRLDAYRHIQGIHDDWAMESNRKPDKIPFSLSLSGELMLDAATKQVNANGGRDCETEAARRWGWRRESA